MSLLQAGLSRRSPDPLPAHQGPRLLRQEDSRGQDRQGSAAGAPAAGQRRHLPAAEGRRAPRRGQHCGPGRAPGERHCRQRGRLAPRRPALRPSHSRTCPHPATAARPLQGRASWQLPADQATGARAHVRLTRGPPSCPGRARVPRAPGAGPGLPAFPAPRGRRGSGVNGRPQAVARQRDAQHPLHRRNGPVTCAAPQKTAAAKPPPSAKLLTPRTKRNRYGADLGQRTCSTGAAQERVLCTGPL